MAAFTPLTPQLAANPKPAGAPSAPSKPSALTPFRSLDQLLQASAASTDAAMPAPAPSGDPCAGQPPTIELQRQNGQITGIRVQCACGRVTQLECVY